MATARGLSVAIMQPYFLPYAGYFRLFASTDLFVIYDCVQFPRRGYVHRNQLTDRQGHPQWLTLPLAHAPVETSIRDLVFASDAKARWQAAQAPFPLASRHEAAMQLASAMRCLGPTPVDYIVDLLKLSCSLLGLPWNVVRSSELAVPGTLRGQDRILEIATRVGASRYVNAPGGVGLYDPAAFARRGLELCFLPPYDGPSPSILQRLCDQDIADLRREFAGCRDVG